MMARRDVAARGARPVASANSYDVIVIGVGGMGSAAVYELARRRAPVGRERDPSVIIPLTHVSL